MKLHLACLFGAALSLLSAISAVAQIEVTSLTALPGFSASDTVADINSSGQITGYGQTSSNQTHAYLYSNSSYTDLGTIGSNPAGSRAASINDSGVVVGEYYPTQGSSFTRPFVYSGGTMTDIGLLGGPVGSSYGFANSVNNSGTVVGGSTVNGGSFHAFVWRNGVMTDIGTLGGTISSASAISDTGYVVGYSRISTSNAISHAFIYSNGTMTDLGSLGITSFATAVNDSGQVVGYSVVGSQNHATLWSNGTMTDLGAGTQAVGINDNGLIIGTTTGGDPFIYSNGTTYDLKTLAFSFLTGATGTAEGFYDIEGVAAINGSNEIIGSGLYRDAAGGYAFRNFVLTVSTATAVPEPAAYAVALGLAGLGMAAYRRRA